MSFLDSFQVNGHTVTMIQYPLSRLNEKSNFLGQKLHHPFKTIKADEEYTIYDKYKKKDVIKTAKILVYDNDFISEEARNDIINSESIMMKHDGSCGYILWNEKENMFIPYARYDVKKDDNDDDTFKQPPKNSIACEPQPTNPDATHWPHMVPCHCDLKAYKWQLHAFQLMIASGKLDQIKSSFTCEYMGKKFNWKSSDPVNEESVIVPHGLIGFNIPKTLRTIDGFKKILETIPFIEGFIIHGKNNIWKIRRDMFYESDKKKKLEWPNANSRQLSNFVVLK